jgi:hypothetical protein
MTRAHWHVHSKIPGYLCECDSHYPLDAAGRDASLRYERNTWRDYIADDPEPNRIRITGSVRSGGFSIDDVDSMGWWRIVESWKCSEPECLELLAD